MVGPVELVTPRLRLRQWRPDDLTACARMVADPEVMKFFPAPLSRTESDELAARCRSLIEERGWGFWAAELREAATFIGFVGLHIPSADLPFSPCVEVGWRLAREHWSRGYATEAATAALEFGFTTLGLGQIVSFTTLGNVRSQAVMHRLGMRRDPEPFEHPALPVGHPLRAHCLYRLDRNVWLDRARPQADAATSRSLPRNQGQPNG